MSERVLGDLADLTVGHVGPMASEYVADGIPFLRSLNVRPFHIDLDGVKYISAGFHQKLAKSALKPGDVVVVRTGAPGTAAVIPETLPVANCSDVVIVRPGAELDARYLAYLINSVARGYIHSRTVGAVQQHFNVGAALGIPIPVASIDEQRRIAAVLGALDDLIETNEVQARALEAAAQATWQRVLPSACSWAEVGSLATVVLGGTPSRKHPDYWGGRIPWLNSGEANRFRVLSGSEGITDAGYANSSTKLMPVGTTLLAITGATLGQVTRLEIEACGNQSLVGVYSDDRALSDHLYLAIGARIDALVQHATGGAQQHVNKGNVEQLRVPWPGKEWLSQVHNHIGPLLAGVGPLLVEAEALRRTRDELLPLLMSGKVRVSEDLAVA